MRRRRKYIHSHNVDTLKPSKKPARTHHQNVSVIVLSSAGAAPSIEPLDQVQESTPSYTGQIAMSTQLKAKGRVSKLNATLARGFKQNHRAGNSGVE